MAGTGGESAAPPFALLLRDVPLSERPPRLGGELGDEPARRYITALCRHSRITTRRVDDAADDDKQKTAAERRGGKRTACKAEGREIL